MALNLSELISPSRTALVIQECQRGVVGDLSALPELAENARPILPKIASLLESARKSGVAVVHCTALRREDGRGANSNARIFRYMAKSPNPLTPGSPAAEVVPELSLDDSDLVLPRLHGLSPFQGTELDFVLRNLGVTTIVAVGVSVNVAIQCLAFDAVNSSYQVVIPRDAVAGFPQEYVEAVFQHTLGAISTLVSTEQINQVWRA